MHLKAQSCAFGAGGTNKTTVRYVILLLKPQGMKPIKFLYPGNNASSVDTMLLLLRLVMGLAFAYYGSFKIKNPMHWMGPDSVYPAFLQLLAAVSEFCGGIALIMGFLTRIASFGLACTMAVATYTHMSNGDPFVNLSGGGSYDHALLFFVLALTFIVLGAGRFSVDRMIFGKRDFS